MGPEIHPRIGMPETCGTRSLQGPLTVQCVEKPNGTLGAPNTFGSALLVQPARIEESSASGNSQDLRLLSYYPSGTDERHQWEALRIQCVGKAPIVEHRNENQPTLVSTWFLRTSGTRFWHKSLSVSWAIVS